MDHDATAALLMQIRDRLLAEMDVHERLLIDQFDAPKRKRDVVLMSLRRFYCDLDRQITQLLKVRQEEH